MRRSGPPLFGRRGRRGHTVGDGGGVPATAAVRATPRSSPGMTHSPACSKDRHSRIPLAVLSVTSTSPSSSTSALSSPAAEPSGSFRTNAGSSTRTILQSTRSRSRGSADPSGGGPAGNSRTRSSTGPLSSFSESVAGCLVPATGSVFGRLHGAMPAWGRRRPGNGEAVHRRFDDSAHAPGLIPFPDRQAECARLVGGGGT